MTAQIITLASARRAPSFTAPEKPLRAGRGRGHRPDDREARFKRWRKALTLFEYYRAFNRLQHAAYAAARNGNPDEAGRMSALLGENWVATADDLRDALAQCILTPAPTRADLEWKRRQIEEAVHFGHITEVKALAAIAADEKWHDENPYRRIPARATNGGTQ